MSATEENPNETTENPPLTTEEDTKEPAEDEKETNESSNSEKSPDYKSFGTNVLNGTIRFLVFIFVGSSFAYLTKIVNERGGLGGTDITKPPFMSDFGLMGCGIDKASSTFKKGVKKLSDMGKKYMGQNVSSKLEGVDNAVNKKKGKVPFSVYAKHSLEEWTFPYKNSVLCNKENVYYEPLNYRLTRWAVAVVAFSYSNGRLGLEYMFETMANDSVSFWLGPIVVYLLLHITPLYGVASHAIGVLTKLGKLIARSMFQLWFPLITFMLAFFATPILVFGGAIVQSLSTLFFLIIYPFIETEKFPFKVNEEMKEFSGGMFIWHNIKKRMKYVLCAYFALLTKYAFGDLGPTYAGGGAALMLMTYFY
tara:strand:+ start:9515 stop:10609 length:1095 start_codon:yes stop_codon:yes gene_type:complete